jgi:hypothetical protein
MVWQKRYSPPGTHPGTLIAPPEASPHVRGRRAIGAKSDDFDTQ